MKQNNPGPAATNEPIPADCCVVDGDVYDLRSFAKVHPGGEFLLNSLGGYDTTVHYYSYHDHRNNAHAAKALAKYKMGKWQGKPTVETSEIDHPDYNSLKEELAKVLPYQNRFAGPEFWFKAALMLGSAVAVEGYMLLHGRTLLGGLVLGWLLALVNLNIQHDANHGAISRNGAINKVMGLTLDWTGGSALLWRVQHVLLHHAETNVVGRDPDVKLSPVGRLDRWTKRLPHHSLQHIYLLPLTLLLPMRWVFIDLRQLVTANYGGHTPISPLADGDRRMGIALRVFFWFRFVLLPLLLYPSLYTAASIFVSFAMAGGYLGLFFIISHNFEGVDHFKPDAGVYDHSWVVRQITGSSTVGGRVLGWLNGGLNYQIEHHLFPRIHHQHYPTIAPVIRQWCADHGVKYNHFPYLSDNLRAYTKHVFALGNTD